jgi:hypothetical protein
MTYKTPKRIAAEEIKMTKLTLRHIFCTQSYLRWANSGAASPYSIVRNIPYVIDRRVGDRDGAAAAGGDVEVRRRMFPVLRQPADPERASVLLAKAWGL